MHQEFFKLLKKDHEELKGLLGQLKETGNGDAEKRAGLFEKLKLEIKPHQEGEEEAMYPPMMKNDKTRDDALESVEEHHASKLILRELDGMNKDSDQWLAKLKVFKEMVEHHIEEEEEKIFSGLKEEFSGEEVKGIMAGFKKEKEAMKRRMA